MVKRRDRWACNHSLATVDHFLGFAGTKTSHGSEDRRPGSILFPGGSIRRDQTPGRRQRSDSGVVFYPKDETPGCTAEACTFRDRHSELTRLGAEVWGVSGDDAVSHRRFAQRYKLPFPLLSDRTQSLRRAFGVPKTFGLLPSRVTYVIDQQGVIRHVFNDLLDGPAHVKEAETIVQQLANA